MTAPLQRDTSLPEWQSVLGHVAFVLTFIAVILLARMIADRLNVPYTIVLTLCGLV